MLHKRIWWLLAIILTVTLVGCQKADPTPTADASVADPATLGGPQANLEGTNRLALGTFKLEGTEDAVTAAQAAGLLPLWQMIGGGSLQGAAETEAVVKQIEAKMTEAQLAAIETMALTFEDMQTWMQEQGIEMRANPGGGQGGGGGGGGGAFQDMSEEDRAKMREEFQNMSTEERATRMAEMGVQRPEGVPGGRPEGAPEGQEGGGGGFGNRGAPGGGRRFNVLLTPLIRLLTERAAE